jgi:hypothetical protein
MAGVRRGHVSAPGGGPVGETCGTCRYLCRVGMKRVYWKCGLSRYRWTGGSATDVRRGDAACVRWEGVSL